jgi:hypothetical protein
MEMSYPHVPAALFLGKQPSVSVGWVGPRTGLDSVEKRKTLPLAPTRNRTQEFHLATRRYSD